LTLRNDLSSKLREDEPTLLFHVTEGRRWQSSTGKWNLNQREFRIQKSKT